MPEANPICPQCSDRLTESGDERGDWWCGNCRVVWPEDDVAYQAKDLG
jgi:tRNA(Ile2) C34 agmatinyltransferase TiaS